MEDNVLDAYILCLFYFVFCSTISFIFECVLFGKFSVLYGDLCQRSIILMVKKYTTINIRI